MPILTNPKHELFAQSLAMGLNASESYRRAGYKSSAAAASRMSNNVNVEARVLELLASAAEKTEITIYTLAAELEIARRIAVEERQASAAVSASMGKAKLFGHGGDKVTVNGKITLEDLVLRSLPAEAPKDKDDAEE